MKITEVHFGEQQVAMCAWKCGLRYHMADGPREIGETLPFDWTVRIVPVWHCVALWGLGQQGRSKERGAVR